MPQLAQEHPDGAFDGDPAHVQRLPHPPPPHQHRCPASHHNTSMGDGLIFKGNGLILNCSIVYSVSGNYIIHEFIYNNHTIVYIGHSLMDLYS